MKKSTKVLLILLGCVIVAAGILIMIYRDQIFASPTPDPQDNTDATTTSEQTEAGVDPDQKATNKAVSVGDCKWDESDSSNYAQPLTDSGFQINLVCKNAEEVNAAPLNSDNTFSLTFDYSFTFTRSCNEYIRQPLMYWGGGDSPERLDQISVPNFDDPLKKSATISGKITHTFKMEQSYAFFYELPIWAAVPIWTRRLGVNQEQDHMYSNGCRITRMPNEEETKGEEIAVSDDKGVTGSSESECEKTCKKEQKCGGEGINIKKVADPICNGFCAMSCYMMDMVAGFFNFSFGILHKAVGLS